jgi:lipopolysaccharide heptosyltransferase I
MTHSRRLSPAPFSTVLADRICLIKPSSLGDIVQTLPVLDALRTRFPAAQISWIANSAYVPLLEPISILDQVIPFDRETFRREGLSSIHAYLTYFKDLARHRFDLVIDLQGLLRSAAMAWATRAKRRIGLASAREGAVLGYSDIISDLPIQQSAVDRYWRVVDSLGVGHLEKRFPLELSNEERQWAERQLAGLERPRLGVQPGARWLTKRWPAEHFSKTVNTALPKGGGSVVLLGGPGEESMADAVAERVERPRRSFCGKTSLRQLAALLEQCDLVLTNDSGPMHLAAAVGTPTVSVFTCTDPRRAAPYGVGHRVVQTSVECRGSYVRECEHLSCMKQLTPELVLPSLNDALREIPSARRSSGLSAESSRPKAA